MAKADDTHRELIALEKRFWQSMEIGRAHV